jgi:hypothetical protein
LYGQYLSHHRRRNLTNSVPLKAYISGNALVVLDGPDHILQTTYLELPDELVAVVFDELSGKIATASPSTVHIYKPYGRDEGALRVGDRDT